MAFSHGLNALESNMSNANEVLIGVHGRNCEGYEWVYPLKVLNTNNKEIYFYRWPDDGCYQAPAENLILEKPLYKKLHLSEHIVILIKILKKP